MRAWPDILDWLSRNKRVTWTLVSANAQPLSFDGSRLVLAIETAGLAETFRRGAHPAFVQEALLEVLGINAKVEGVVSDTAKDAGRGGTASAGAITTPASLGGPARPQPDQVQQDRQAQSGTPRTPGSGPDPNEISPSAAGGSAPPMSGAGSTPDFMPARPPSANGPDWSSAPPAASSAPAWATDGDDPLDRAPASRPEVQATPDPGPQPSARPEDLTDDPDAISDDDEDIEASGEVGSDVVVRLLGGTVISEDDD